MSLDPASCYRALQAHDRRFDGKFFVGVATTGIYCRPVCTVRAPRRENCSFFASAAAAEVAGYRPCLRCRPELAPGNAGVDTTARLAQAAVGLIENGVFDDGGIEALAARIGVTGRHLRRIFDAEFGVSPVEYAQTQRLLLAKRLLTDTTLPVTEVALASGFASVRRFNALWKARYRMAPSRLRRDTRRARDAGAARLRARVPPAVRLGRDARVPRRARHRRRRGGDGGRVPAHARRRPARRRARRLDRGSPGGAQAGAGRRRGAVAGAGDAGGAGAGEARVRPQLRPGGRRGSAGKARRAPPRAAPAGVLRRVRAGRARSRRPADHGARRADGARPPGRGVR